MRKQHDMNENNPSNDPLEEELAGLRPLALSEDFQARLAQRLESKVETRPKPNPASYWLAAATIAAAIALAAWPIWHFLLRKQSPPERPELAAPEVPSVSEELTDFPQPTLLAYSRALGQGEDELENLLDLHAGMLLPKAESLHLTSTSLFQE